jgi:hypothetical protein
MNTMNTMNTMNASTAMGPKCGESHPGALVEHVDRVGRLGAIPSFKYWQPT